MAVKGEESVRVLVVEDESIVALDMKNRLSSLGYKVTGIAATGLEAVEKARTTNPDIILMDIKLRGDMDGLRAADLIHEELDVPIIFITAFADERTLARAKETEAFGYVLKPFQEREVLISIEMALYKYRTEHELRNSRDWLNGSLNAISDAVVAVDTQGLIVFFNHAAARLLGCPEEDLISRPLSDFCSFHDDRFLEKMRLEHTGHASRGAWKLMKSTRASIPVELMSAPLQAPAKQNVQGTVYSIRDISDVVMAQRVRYRLSSVLANSNDAILAFDRDLRIISWNSGAERLYGYSPEQILGDSLEKLLPGKAVRQRMLEKIDSALSSNDQEAGTSISFESFRKKKNNRRLHVASSLFVVPRPDNLEPELVLIERDVSAEKEYEASLVKARILAEETSRAKSEFLSNMTHELRTPLNSIIGMVELARENAQSGHAATDEQVEYLSIARHSAESLLFLINSILDYSKIEASKMDVRSYQFDMVDLLHDCIESVSVQSWHKGLELSYLYEPECPSLALGDPHRIRQIVINLLANAIKYTDHGYVALSLSCSPSDTGVNFHICVRDSGSGIPEERIAHIWEKFTQLDGSSTRMGGGTGLGLAIVKSLVDLLGGQVSVESTMGEGSSFTVSLPLTLVESGLPAVSPQEDLADFSVAFVGGSERARSLYRKLCAAWSIPSSFHLDARHFLKTLGKGTLSPQLVCIDDALVDRDILLAEANTTALPSGLRAFVVLCSLGSNTDHLWRALPAPVHFMFKPPRRAEFLSLLRVIRDGEAPSSLVGLHHSSLPLGLGRLSSQGVLRPESELHPEHEVLEDQDPADESGAPASFGTQSPHSQVPEAPSAIDTASDTEACYDELLSKAPILIAFCTFMREFSDSMQRDAPRFEQELNRYRRDLVNMGSKALSRRFFKMLLALRRGDTALVEQEYRELHVLHERIRMLGPDSADIRETVAECFAPLCDDTNKGGDA